MQMHVTEKKNYWKTQYITLFRRLIAGLSAVRVSREASAELYVRQ